MGTAIWVTHANHSHLMGDVRRATTMWKMCSREKKKFPSTTNYVTIQHRRTHSGLIGDWSIYDISISFDLGMVISNISIFVSVIIWLLASLQWNNQWFALCTMPKYDFLWQKLCAIQSKRRHSYGIIAQSFPSFRNPNWTTTYYVCSVCVCVWGVTWMNYPGQRLHSI